MNVSRQTAFRLLITTLSLVCVIALLELTAYFIIVVQNKNFYLPLELKNASDPELVNQFAQIYCRTCGWHPHYKSHKFHYRGERKAHDRAILALFGDSFTQGYREIEHSWPFLLEKKLQKPVLNFGVGGYGSDQAYWHFEQHYIGHFNAPYVALVIMPGDISRNLNMYRGFFQRKTYINATKPRYSIDADGKIILLANPLQCPEDLANLGDMNYLRYIGKNDYWYKHYEKHGLNQMVSFPYSYYLLRAIPFYAREFVRQRLGNSSEYKPLYDQTDAVTIQRYIITKFINRAAQIKSRPIILFLPSWTDLIDYQETGSTVYESFFHEIQKTHPLTYDALDYFSARLQQGDEVADFFISRTNGHYNPYAEKVLSDGFYLDFVRLDSTF